MVIGGIAIRWRKMIGDIATRWRVLSGKKKWEGLLEPLDIDLRRSIIHYGERVGAVTVVDEPKSKNYRLARYEKGHLFSNVGLEKGNPYKYIVKEHLYAAHLRLSLGKSNFVGFVATTTDEGSEVLGRRDILICWRGTKLQHEWGIRDETNLVSASHILGKENNPMVHQGRLSYYTDLDHLSSHNQFSSCRDQVLAALKEELNEYKGEEMSITVSGYSMGGAIGTLNAADIVRNGYNKLTGLQHNVIPVTAILFGSSRLGNQGFKNVVSSLETLHILRVVNDQDDVPGLPDSEEYVHVGEELRIDTLKSPYLKVIDDRNVTNLHDLEVYLHGVAGTQEIESSDFKLEVNRDISLINKYIDGLKDEYNVVTKWWTEKNKSMVQMDGGSWVLDDREFVD